MPAYFWIQLYKNPEELSIEKIVTSTIESLLSQGCQFAYSQITEIEDDNLPWMEQRPIKYPSELSLEKSMKFAIDDIRFWLTEENEDKKWLPAIRLNFDFNFKFDDKVLAKMTTQTLSKANQVQLDFWIKGDKYYNKVINIHIIVWEEYVLMYGNQETHNQNKEKILSMVNKVCEEVIPYYGWLDSEINSVDATYNYIDKPDWILHNSYIVLGDQLAKHLPPYDATQVRLINKTKSGVSLLTYVPKNRPSS